MCANEGSNSLGSVRVHITICDYTDLQGGPKIPHTDDDRDNKCVCM